MQVAQAKLIGVIDDDCVGIGNIKTGFNDVGTNENIMFLVDKIEECFFELVRLHLAMRHGDINIRTDASDQRSDFGKCFDTVMNKEYLATAIDFIINCISDHFFVKDASLCMDRLAIRWWSADNG